MEGRVEERVELEGGRCGGLDHSIYEEGNLRPRRDTTPDNGNINN